MNAPDPLLKIAKIARSVQHAKTLASQVKAFFESDDHGVIADFNSDPGYLVIRAFSRAEHPGEWCLIIGETLYQFRSALDHLACQLTEDNRQPVHSRVDFPIFLKREGFRKGDALTESVRQSIGGMSLANQAKIEGEQPFQGKYGVSEDDPLWTLYCLSNYDRHRNLHVVNTTIRDMGREIEPRAFADRYFTQVSSNYGKPFEGETEVARYRIDPAANDVVPPIQVNVKAHVMFNIAFDEKGPGAGRPVISTLGAIGDRVARLLGQFY